MEYIQRLKEIYGRIPEKDKEIVADFFSTFSFFEFGIKELGITKNGYNYPSPDWKEYIKAIETKFNPENSPELHAAVKFFCENPPGKQVFNKVNGALIFDDSYFSKEDNIDLQLLIAMIIIVRNNFFHGGKVKDFMKNEYENNINLFKNSLIIFEECLRIDDRMSEFL